MLGSMGASVQKERARKTAIRFTSHSLHSFFLDNIIYDINMGNLLKNTLVFVRRYLFECILK